MFMYNIYKSKYFTLDMILVMWVFDNIWVLFKPTTETDIFTD